MSSFEDLNERARAEKEEWNRKAWAAVGGKGGVPSPRAIHLAVAADVAQKYGVSLQEVMSTSRLKKLVTARHAAWAEVARRFPWISSPQLARMFKRDHSTILYALHKHKVEGRGLHSISARRAARIAAQTGGNGGEVQPETTQETSNGMV